MVGTPREGVNESVANVAEYRADDTVEKLVGKLVSEAKFDLAGIVRQRFEMPIAFEQTERSVDQLDTHEAGRLLVVFRGEVRPDAQIVDM